MNPARIGIICVTILLGGLTLDAQAQWPDFCSTATTAAPAGVTPVLYNLPSGQGAAFTQARALGGAVNATITLTLYDAGCMPVANFSAADMWLQKEVVAGTGNFNACIGGTIADSNTNANGVTHWTSPLRAGGWSTSKTLVIIAGSAMTSNSGLLLRHNSADINGDGKADLTDVPLFATDFFAGTNAFRSDLRFDGVVNLSDIPLMTSAIGAACP